MFVFEFHNKWTIWRWKFFKYSIAISKVKYLSNAVSRRNFTGKIFFGEGIIQQKLIHRNFYATNNIVHTLKNLSTILQRENLYWSIWSLTLAAIFHFTLQSQSVANISGIVNNHAGFFVT